LLAGGSPEQDVRLRGEFNGMVRPRRIADSYTRRSLKILHDELGFMCCRAQASWALRYAAVAILALVVLLGGLAYSSLFEGGGRPQVAMQTVSCDAGSTRVVAFPDGTRVTLKGESEIVFTGDYAERRHIMLDGEAFFSVAHDAARPFTGDGGGMSVVVLGTEFNMQTGQNAGVLLISGSVEVSTPERQVYLEPGQKMVFDGGRMDVVEAGAGEQAHYTGQPLSLYDITLHEALAEIGDYFGVEMAVAPSVPEVSGVMLHLTENETLEHAMEIVHATNPVFNYVITTEKVIIR
jgi:ferric-dicitrate binding protein FerR (iron transport regulator)